MTDCIPCAHALSESQCFPLYWYDVVESSLFGSVLEAKYNISKGWFEDFKKEYGDETINQEDMFYYIYGVLSSPEYAERFGKDTKRILVRVPLLPYVNFSRNFRKFADAGRELGQLHVECKHPHAIRCALR